MSKKTRKTAVKEIIEKLPKETVQPRKRLVDVTEGKKVKKSTTVKLENCKKCHKTNLENGYIIKKAETNYNGLNLNGLCRVCMIQAINEKRAVISTE